jgi:hypothetical protein
MKTIEVTLHPIPNLSEEHIWSVWVGGMEVNDYPLTKPDAIQLAIEYYEDGYNDVSIECIGMFAMHIKEVLKQKSNNNEQ